MKIDLDLIEIINIMTESRIQRSILEIDYTTQFSVQMQIRIFFSLSLNFEKLDGLKTGEYLDLKILQ